MTTNEQLQRAIEAAKARQTAKANGEAPPQQSHIAELNENKTFTRKARPSASQLISGKVTPQQSPPPKLGKAAASSTKLEKARAKLSLLTEKQEETIAQLKSEYSLPEILQLIEHLQFHTREVGLTKAMSSAAPINVGDKVEIIDGTPHYVGRVGIVIKSQRIRCYVQLDDVEKPVYLYTTDVKHYEEKEDVEEEISEDEEVSQTDND